VTPAPRYHPWQDGVGHLHDPHHIGVDHARPVVEVGLIGRAHAERQAGVVDQNVDGCKRVGQAFDRRIDGGAIGYVEDQGIERVAQRGLERLQPIFAPPGRDHFVAFADEPFGDGVAETGGRAGH
jgi:hypothetical protein